MVEKRPTQEEKIIDLLRGNFNRWVSAVELSKISLQYSARIFALRKSGFQIENRTRTVNGTKHGFFKLAGGFSLIPRTAGGSETAKGVI